MEKLLLVTRTAFPNGDVTNYNFGMTAPKLLLHNDPRVQAMKYQRSVNEFKG